MELQIGVILQRLVLGQSGMDGNVVLLRFFHDSSNDCIFWGGVV